MSDTARTDQVLGAEATVTAPRGRGSVNFTNYARDPLVHTVAVTASRRSTTSSSSCCTRTPGGSRRGRAAQGYTQILDNERVRVWRLVLEPGPDGAPPSLKPRPASGSSSTAARSSRARPASPTAAKAPRSGEFFWQEAGTTRAVRNVGATRIELVELELK